MPSAIAIDDKDVLLVIDLQADFMPGGALAVEEGSDRPLVNALARLRPCRCHPGLASARTRLLRFDPRREAVRASGSIPAIRPCGLTIAYRGPPGRRSIPQLETDNAFLILRKGMHEASIPTRPSRRRTARRRPGSRRS